MALVARFKTLLDHPAGPRTIFFWAPAMKWALVIANIGDLQRPAERISLTQSASLTATGAIWSRYSLVIVPKNWNLFSVNIFVFITGFYQLARALRYKYETDQANKLLASPLSLPSTSTTATTNDVAK